ncbi:ABC-2 type transport system ATP-binding protein [Geomicrobium halophilum]|uniref:ABC-2 type transport system ATP-binding protein n=1 Tax=Geomicrobium halophilum TaxID=549000 RepID=A0A841PRH5_9BACL|nr:ABC transporter ATP-binding protein [Geomicrobium halophilum]MBB6451379.1 ABC-2 type transport system ATP-binding protein [Geomicrobium halophilum]
MITIQNVNKRYKETRALQNIDLSIPSGVCYGFVGPNGAGKSSLIKILAGVVKDYEGSIHVSDANPPSLGYVPQEVCLEETLSATTNLHFYGKIQGLKGEKLIRQVKTVLDDIGLTNRANSKVKTFSGGMKRRLNIGCALMHEPDLVIMDEPTVGVDPQSRLHIFQMIRSLKQQGKTIIYASHYMEEIEELCDEVAFIDGGKIVEQGSIDDLLTSYAQPAVFIKGDIPKAWLDFENVIQQKDGGWLFASSNPMQLLGKLAQRCEEQNIMPSQLSLMQPRLEDVFFTLTGTALRDTA